MSTSRAGVASVVSAAVFVACWGGGTTAGSAIAATTPKYALTPTSACLKGRGAKVGAIQPRDARMRALRDFAQKRSIQAVLKGKLVGLAFLGSPGEARIIADLLKVPRDPYRLVRRGNTLLMYKPAAKQAFTTATACLRA